MSDHIQFTLRLATEADFAAIIALQNANTPTHLSAEQRRQGYIVSRMEHAQLAAISAQLGIMLALQGNVLAGFVCMMPPEARPRPAVVDAMLAAADEHSLDRQPLRAMRLFLYGPVCIAREFRARGLLRRLFNAVKTHLHDRYDAGLAFIADDNPHSLAAHVQGLGMCDVARFSSGGQDYHLIAFKV